MCVFWGGGGGGRRRIAVTKITGIIYMYLDFFCNYNYYTSVWFGKLCYAILPATASPPHQFPGSLTSMTKTVEFSLVDVLRLCGHTQMHRLSAIRSPRELSWVEENLRGAKTYVKINCKSTHTGGGALFGILHTPH